MRFLWLIPITPEEAEFKKQNGLEALEERFEAANFDYLDPSRPPSCRMRGQIHEESWKPRTHLASDAP